MKFLFVHNNFPGQFAYLAHHLAGKSNHEVFAIGGETARPVPGVHLQKYRLGRSSSPGILDLAIRFEADCIRGQAAALLAQQIARQGFVPDVIVGHSGWGDALFLKEIWPGAKIAVHAEYYYRWGDEAGGFDPEFRRDTIHERMRVFAKNAALAIAVSGSDLAIAPTQFQRARYPEALRRHIQVVHEGIDTRTLAPRPNLDVALPVSGRVLTGDDEVITYVNRHLEPLRGLHIFLRSLPEILQSRPSAQVVIVGDDSGTGYGRPPPGAKWRNVFLKELGSRIDPTRVHWLGRVHPKRLADIYAISRAHVYLTYPFVLSWSMLEAMSAGCLIVGSRTAPVEEVITHGHNGLLVDFFDTGGLSRTIIDALSRPREDFAELRAAARATIVERYDRATVCLPQLVNLLEGLAAQ